MDRLDEMIQQNKDYKRAQDGFPEVQRAERPIFSGLTGDDGNLLSKYMLAKGGDVKAGTNLPELMQMLSGINLNTQGLDEIRKRALTQGPSTWANMMLDKEGIDHNAALDNAASTEQGGLNRAFSTLATRGGLSTGARERLATKSMQDLYKGRADVNRASDSNRLGILTTDESQKLDLLKGLPGMENQALQPAFQKAGLWSDLANNENKLNTDVALQNRAYGTDVDKANIGNLISNTTNKQNFDLAKYSEDMKAWAADRTARAQENSGKK